MSVDIQKLKQLLAEALELPATERAAFVERSCANDPALRVELERLLDAHARAGDFLEKTVELPPSDLVIERTGTMIGRYKLLERIGEGGFGVVFMAEQQEPVQRKVALKIIKAGMDTREVIARFEAERQALALMDHPNIAKILDGGVTGASDSQPSTLNSQLSLGRPYFVMELVRGMPITEYCDQNNLPTADRLQLFMQVCQAVQHAHQKGIIHRDLKPTNILVTLIDGQAVPKVIDFGVAKALGQRLTEKTLFTGFQQMIGTPAYMSPEQAALSGVDVDTRSDIYSLGVLLYELLTGETPFDKETLHKAALDEIRRLIRETEPSKPSTRLQALVAADVRRLKSSNSQPSTLNSQPADGASSRRLLQIKETIRLVRGDLDWIVMKALEKDRARRYETASTLLEDIQRYLNHEPVHASPPSAAYRARKFIRRHRLGVAFAAAVVVALALGLVTSLIGFAQARHERDRAEAGEKKAQAEATKSRQLAQFLEDMLNGVGPSVALGRDTTMLREILDRSAGRVGKELRDQPEVEAELRSVIGSVYISLGLQESAIVQRERAWELRRKTFGDNHPKTLSSKLSYASSLAGGGRYTQAEAIAREILGIYREKFGNESLQVSHALQMLGNSLKGQHKWEECLPALRESVRLKKQIYGDEDPRICSAVFALGAALMDSGHFDEAASHYEAALKLEQKGGRAEGEDTAFLTELLGRTRFQQGQLVEAERLLREALTMRRKFFDKDHPQVASNLAHLAMLLTRQSRFTEADRALSEAWQIMQKHPAESPHLTYRVLSAHKVLYEKWSETDDSKQPLAAEWAEKLSAFLQTHPGLQPWEPWP